MPVTPIVQGKTYAHRHGLLRAQGGAVAVLLPDGYNGRLNKESIFKIFSDDQRISCFLRFHDAATPLPRGWISEPFPLEGQQMTPVGPAKTKKGAHSRRFEGAPYVAYKAEKRDAHGNGNPVRLPPAVSTQRRSRRSCETFWTARCSAMPPRQRHRRRRGPSRLGLRR